MVSPSHDNSVLFLPVMLHEYWYAGSSGHFSSRISQANLHVFSTLSIQPPANIHFLLSPVRSNLLIFPFLKHYGRSLDCCSALQVSFPYLKDTVKIVLLALSSSTLFFNCMSGLSLSRCAPSPPSLSIIYTYFTWVVSA
jgi:hypothetical protein